MTQPNDICIACGTGKCRSLQRDLAVETEDGLVVTVPKVLLLRCDACGEEVIPARSHKYLDSYVADQAEQLSPDDVGRLFDRINDTQQAICEHLGFGSKTLSRWLSGLQHPNRAMGFYLRAMAEFPSVYDWIKERKWKHATSPLTSRPERTMAGGTASNYMQGRVGPQLTPRGTAPPMPNYAQAFRKTALKAA